MAAGLPAGGRGSPPGLEPGGRDGKELLLQLLGLLEGPPGLGLGRLLAVAGGGELCAALGLGRLGRLLQADSSVPRRSELWVDRGTYSRLK